MLFCFSSSGTRSTSGTQSHRQRGETITGNGTETVSEENEGTEIDMDRRCRQERIIHRRHRREMGQSWRIVRRIRWSTPGRRGSTWSTDAESTTGDRHLLPIRSRVSLRGREILSSIVFSV